MSELVIGRGDIASDAMTFVEYESSVKPCFDNPVTKTTIRNVQANSYLLGGLYEEFAETLEFDAAPPSYSRIGMIALRNDNPLLDVYRQDTNSLEYHRREFGDLLWYMTALLHRMNISLAVVGESDIQSDITRFDEYAAVAFASDLPIKDYRAGFSAFARSVANVLFRVNPESCTTVARSSRALLGSMSWIAQNRLGTSLASIALGNVQKLAARERNGTVFGVGDNR